MKIMAFIPARGGSKGIPRKNLVSFDGAPLIQHTIDAAKKSTYIKDLFVSSDDREIIDCAMSLGVEVPYVRPAYCASDSASMVDTLLDALDWLKQNGKALPDSIILLQPTSPMRTAKHIDEAIAMFIEQGLDSLVSVHQVDEHPYECIRFDDRGWRFLEKPLAPITRRQDYKESFYYINGAIYLVKTDFFVREKVFIAEGRTGIYFMDRHDGVDIDDVYDLKCAELYAMMKKQHTQHG